MVCWTVRSVEGLTCSGDFVKAARQLGEGGAEPVHGEEAGDAGALGKAVHVAVQFVEQAEVGGRFREGLEAMPHRPERAPGLLFRERFFDAEREWGGPHGDARLLRSRRSRSALQVERRRRAGRRSPILSGRPAPRGWRQWRISPAAGPRRGWRSARGSRAARSAVGWRGRCIRRVVFRSAHSGLRARSFVPRRLPRRLRRRRSGSAAR